MFAQRVLAVHRVGSLAQRQSREIGARARQFSAEAQPSGKDVWQEVKNRQGRSYYENTVTKVRTWDHPGSEVTVLKFKKKSPLSELKTVSDKVTYLLTNSAGAYYGLFFVVCAGLAYRIYYPSHPDAPSVDVK